MLPLNCANDAVVRASIAAIRIVILVIMSFGARVSAATSSRLAELYPWLVLPELESHLPEQPVIRVRGQVPLHDLSERELCPSPCSSTGTAQVVCSVLRASGSCREHRPPAS